MTTLVGTQSNFNDAVKELIELEYDAIGAYELAIKRLGNLAYQAKLKEFLADHERHVSEIKEFYKGKSVSLPDSGDFIKGGLAKLKVAIGNATGSDKNILRAMLTNEMDTNTAYERMNHHQEMPNEEAIILILKSAYKDEIRHKEWLEVEISAFEGK